MWGGQLLRQSLWLDPKDHIEDFGLEELTLQYATALHSSALAWEIPWAEEPGRLQSMGSRRVGHD